MTDTQKLEAIKAEIERRKNEAFLNASFNECKQFILNELQRFIATLDEQRDTCDTCANDNDLAKSNRKKCEEISELDWSGEAPEDRIYQAAYIMAEWKDRQFKREREMFYEQFKEEQQ